MDKTTELKQKVKVLQAEGKYEDGLITVIELFNLGCQDVDVIFAAAQFYFMANDYERSNIWINKLLDMDPGNIEARVLLVKICVLLGREQDALDIMEVILKVNENNLKYHLKMQMEELLEVYKLTKLDIIKVKYPHIKSFLNIDETNELKMVNSTVPDIKVKIVSLRKDFEQQQDQGVTIEKTENKSAQEIINEILNKKISLQEKIKLCNSFAGAYYYENRLSDAELMLKKIIDLDEKNSSAYRNLSFIEIARGNKIKAQKYADKLPLADFSLLYYIKKIQ
ncbi:MAG: hypothetical protein ACRC7I_14830 [Selenomonadaceae bacterium]